MPSTRTTLSRLARRGSRSRASAARRRARRRARRAPRWPCRRRAGGDAHDSAPARRPRSRSGAPAAAAGSRISAARQRAASVESEPATGRRSQPPALDVELRGRRRAGAARPRSRRRTARTVPRAHARATRGTGSTRLPALRAADRFHVRPTPCVASAHHSTRISPGTSLRAETSVRVDVLCCADGGDAARGSCCTAPGPTARRSCSSIRAGRSGRARTTAPGRSRRASTTAARTRARARCASSPRRPARALAGTASWPTSATVRLKSGKRGRWLRGRGRPRRGRRPQQHVRARVAAALGPPRRRSRRSTARAGSASTRRA